MGIKIDAVDWETFLCFLLKKKKTSNLKKKENPKKMLKK
jgi:hypothetical protein